MTDPQFLALKATIARHRRERANRNARFPNEVRQEAVAHAKSRRAAGASLNHIAVELGVALSTVERWLRVEPPRRKLRRVSVQRGGGEQASKASLVLHGPGGVRVEGLDAGSVAAILRALM